MKTKLFLSTLFLFTSLLIFGQRKENPTPIQLPEISKELIKMRDQDQKYRRKWGGMIKKGKSNSKKFKKLTRKLAAIDRKNTKRIKEIVVQYGWPTYDLVGERGSHCAWVVTQHADMNPLVQAYCLPLLKEAVDKNQANPSNYAYLYDRVQVAKGEKQLYATQSTTNNGLKTGFFQPIEDESNVQNRRTEMGISKSIETYAQELGFKYEIPSEEEAIKRDKEWAKAYRENKELALQAMKKKDYSTAVKHYGIAMESNGYIQAEDYVELARAISISKHKASREGFYFLIKAAFKGFQGINEFDTHEDFKNIKLANPERWLELMAVVEELNK